MAHSSDSLPDDIDGAAAEKHFEDALAAHDRAVAAAGLEIWLGAEPTFTDRFSEAPQWLYEALGEDKRVRAERMLAALAASGAEPGGAALLRSAGRPYAGEPVPRWSLGVYVRRDGRPAWSGPPDPLLCAAAPHSHPSTQTLAQALAAVLEAAGGGVACLRGVGGDAQMRVVYSEDGTAPPDDPAAEPELARVSPHASDSDAPVLRDPLAERGFGLLVLGHQPHGEGDGALRVELPGLTDTARFLRLLEHIAQAARACGCQALVLAGYPPPVDGSVAWTTLTPDPAVIEVNMAPAADAREFARRVDQVAAAARACGLAALRLHYNGLETDSGGGGQVTLGGPTPARSPFLRRAHLLPGLVRYLNRHPALSYLHAPESVGGASQAPRADEGSREAFMELDLALALLERAPAPAPEVLWAALAPFLTDASGNAHRAELNIEKLWSTGLGARGRLGLVEFRAFRMARTPHALIARGVLLRAIAAMLAVRPFSGALVDWGDALHDRFSLPFFLCEDLRAVLADLAAAGFGLAPPLARELLDVSHRILARVQLPEGRLTLRRAVEFWPLLGDVASQERGGSRLLDASTARLELCLRPAAGAGAPAGLDLDGWRAWANGIALPLHRVADADGPALLAGVRYRAFAPQRGLHPGLPAQVPLVLVLAHAHGGAHRLTVHEWRPDGGGYDGLPRTVAEARARRAARCVLDEPRAPPPADAAPPAEAAPSAGARFVLDLRRPS